MSKDNCVESDCIIPHSSAAETEKDVILEKLQYVQNGLAPLRFLLSNFKANGTSPNDDQDIQALGQVIEEKLNVLTEVHSLIDQLKCD